MNPLTRRDAVTQLSTHLCKVIFKKKTTGEIREMNCTLDPTHMPSGAYESLGNYDRYRPYTSKGTQSRPQKELNRALIRGSKNLSKMTQQSLHKKLNRAPKMVSTEPPKGN